MSPRCPGAIDTATAVESVLRVEGCMRHCALSRLGDRRLRVGASSSPPTGSGSESGLAPQTPLLAWDTRRGHTGSLCTCCSPPPPAGKASPSALPLF